MRTRTALIGAATALGVSLLPTYAAAGREPTPGEAYAARGFGVFMHYGLATFVGKTPWKYDPHDIDPAVYDPSNFDPDQWMRAIKAAGGRYVVFTTKHHDGFAMWPSAYTDWGVERSAQPDIDVVGEVAAAARRHGLDVAFYYSWWDKMEPGGNVLSGQPPTPEYIRFAKNQMKELLTRYGPVAGIWLDIPTGADLQDLADFIHGVSPETAFVPNLRKVSEAEDVTSFEGPDLEMIPCDYQGKPAEQAYNVAGGPGWWEMSDDSLPKGDTDEVTSTLAYVNHLKATLSLNVSPGPTGRFPPATTRLLEAVGDRVRGDDLLADAKATASAEPGTHTAGEATDLLAKTYWEMPTGGPAWLRVDLPAPMTIDRTLVQFTGPDAVDGYRIEYLDTQGKWRKARRGRGSPSRIRLDKVGGATTSSLRLRVEGARAGAGVVEFKAYGGADDTAGEYEGTWQAAANDRAFNGTLHRSDEAGATATFQFTGNGLDLHAATGPGQGIARVSVDGAEPERVDLYSPQAGNDRAVFRRTGLKTGNHTVTIEVTGERNPSSNGSTVSVDRITPLRALAPFTPGGEYVELPDGRLAYDDTGNRCAANSPITYSGPWRSGGWAGAFQGTRHFDYHPGSYAELEFEGTGAAVLAQTRPAHGIAEISVDGDPPERVDTYSDPFREQVEVWNKTGLPPGKHTIRVTVTGDKNPESGGTWIGLDAIVVTP